MEELPPQQRMALSLRYDNDLNYEEIADVLQISLKAVERSLARGRATLAVRLGESRKDNPNAEGDLRP